MITLAREFYTDGSCYPNPGPGGWAVIDDDLQLVKGGHLEFTTNIVMEGMGILAGLHYAGPGPATIWTDSEFWVKVLKGEYHPQKNAELVMNLRSTYASTQTQVRWVKGHNGHPGNEKADQEALVQRRYAAELRQAEKESYARSR